MSPQVNKGVVIPDRTPDGSGCQSESFQISRFFASWFAISSLQRSPRSSNRAMTSELPKTPELVGFQDETFFIHGVYNTANAIAFLDKKNFFTGFFQIESGC